MATYVMSWTVQANDDDDVNAVAGEADNLIGSFMEGSTPNGYTGFRVIGGGNVKITDTNYWHAT